MTSASRFSDEASSQEGGVRESQRAREAAKYFEISLLPVRQPPLASSCWLHGTLPGSGQVNVILSQEALRQIAAYGKTNLLSELGGALLGHAFRHEDRLFVEVKATVPAVSGDHGPVHFKFTADSWAQLHKDRSAAYPDLEVVGWFHTHPDLGVFYSSDDVVVHSAAFTLPWQVGLVVDPVRSEACFFGWVQGKLTALDGFYERHENSTESAISWNLVPSEVWHEGRTLAESAGGVYTPANRWPQLPAFLAPLSLLVGVLGLILGFFLLVGWVIPLNRQLARQESVLLTLADQIRSQHASNSCPDAQLRILTPVNGEELVGGSRFPLIGTASLPEAYSYRVEVRVAGTSDWTLLESRRLPTELGQLAVWDTEGFALTTYEVRLTAVDRNNIILSGSTPCAIELGLGL